ncbi:hypothetical protein GQ54DRAFT_298033 [Martensiomyces pterosporus]|nr:hypothetical protein GQ54DRAFT_298033 [Martensiomyces pterosporus]
MHILATLVLMLGLFGDSALSTDLIRGASTITDVTWYTSQVSSMWASVFYAVNMELHNAKNMGGQAAYSEATWLYGTTELPASVVTGWAAGYLGRAHEMATKTATAATETAPSSDSQQQSTASPTTTPAPSTASTAPTSTTKNSSAVTNVSGANTQALAMVCALVAVAIVGYY